MTTSSESKQLNSALFIDFDNIYINLAEQDKQAAEKFSTNPDRWLSWFERQLPTNYCGDFVSRRILIRRCYLNPNSFAGYRPHFIRSAFEVIDCPPLTARGKTSTDIHVVMDVLDALSHQTYFHEFIILSGDADFTPVLLNLRKHARYSVVLSVGYASPAYKASSDYLVRQSVFMETALGISYEDDEQTVSAGPDINRTTKELLKRMADRVYEKAVSPTGIPGNDLPEVYKAFAEFTQGNHWLGFYSLRRLTKAIVDQHDDLVMIEDEDSWSVARKVFADWLYSVDDKRKATQLISSQQDLRVQVADWVNNVVASSPNAISLGMLAQSILHRFSEDEIGSNWLGAGTFKNLLLQLNLIDLQISPGAYDSPGYIYDPRRHSLAVNGQPEEVQTEVSNQDVFAGQYPEITPLAKKIHQLTEMPYLMPEHYGLLLREIAREVNEHGYQMTRTSRTVRDRCIERGAPIARSHVNFVLTGLYHTGYLLGSQGEETANVLGDKLVENTYNLCRAAQLDLSESDRRLIETWLLSKIDTDHD